MTHSLVADLQTEFDSLRDPNKVAGMEAYMRHQFPFLGIAATPRKQAVNECYKKYKGYIEQHLPDVVSACYSRNEREWHYAGVDLLCKAHRSWSTSTEQLFEITLTTHPWWDTVDTVAVHAVGKYLTKFPERRDAVIENFVLSGDLWKQRTALIFQLGYRHHTDWDLLGELCLQFSGSKEFFIQKAMGWALRQYARTNPQAVKSFVSANQLPALTVREATKHLKV